VVLWYERTCLVYPTVNSEKLDVLCVTLHYGNSWGHDPTMSPNFLMDLGLVAENHCIFGRMHLRRVSNERRFAASLGSEVEDDADCMGPCVRALFLYGRKYLD
jgi:hypothetical protein